MAHSASLQAALGTRDLAFGLGAVPRNSPKTNSYDAILIGGGHVELRTWIDGGKSSSAWSADGTEPLWLTRTGRCPEC